jgi:hypothetical protein
VNRDARVEDAEMTRRPTAPWGAALALTIVTAACGGSSTSAPTSPGTGGGSSPSASHNAGQDCLRCHRDFGVAGTVYRADGSAYSGATVRLTTAASGGGSVILSVTTDASGNFHTSQSVGFGSGLFADVAGTGGARRSMEAAVTSGACNSCHDASNRIRAD